MSLRAVAVVLTVLYAWHTQAKNGCEDCKVVVKISSGPICGTVQLAENATKYFAFRGIPYAKPPIGAGRFAELEKCDPWVETLHTVEEGPACPQQDIFYGSIPVQPKGMQEDCIYANVYVPENANLNSVENNCKGLPILVNIHGGGFQTGSGNADLHGPEYFMHKDNIIVMSFNYRIAALGFLSLNSVKIPGNAGLRDMVFFLKWVQENARVFGGNPKHVTLIGQSVGATSVHLLTMSKAAEGLFQRGIMLSGNGIPNAYTASPTYAEYISGKFLEAAGITATDPDVIHQQLIQMSLDDIMYANNIVQYLAGITAFFPVVESNHKNSTKIVPDNPLTMIAQRQGCNIPLIVGFTNNEGVFFRPPSITRDLLNRVHQNHKLVLPPRLLYSLNDTEATVRADMIIERYSNGTLTRKNLLKIISDTFFVYPAIKLAQFRSAMGCAPLYLYEYSYESSVSMIKRALWEHYSGASHLEDFTFMFRTNTLLGDYVSFPPRNKDDHMKDWMVNFVTNFIRCNNPTCRNDAVSPWPPVNHTQLRLQSIAEPKVFSMVEPSDEYKDMVNFFDSIDPDIKHVSESLNIEPFQ